MLWLSLPNVLAKGYFATTWNSYRRVCRCMNVFRAAISSSSTPHVWSEYQFTHDFWESSTAGVFPRRHRNSSNQNKHHGSLWECAARKSRQLEVSLFKSEISFGRLLCTHKAVVDRMQMLKIQFRVLYQKKTSTDVNWRVFVVVSVLPALAVATTAKSTPKASILYPSGKRKCNKLKNNSLKCFLGRNRVR